MRMTDEIMPILIIIFREMIFFFSFNILRATIAKKKIRNNSKYSNDVPLDNPRIIMTIVIMLMDIMFIYGTLFLYIKFLKTIPINIKRRKPCMTINGNLFRDK
jgi:uncharacterized membrane protein